MRYSVIHITKNICSRKIYDSPKSRPSAAPTAKTGRNIPRGTQRQAQSAEKANFIAAHLQDVIHICIHTKEERVREKCQDNNKNENEKDTHARRLLCSPAPLPKSLQWSRLNVGESASSSAESAKRSCTTHGSGAAKKPMPSCPTTINIHLLNRLN